MVLNYLNVGVMERSYVKAVFDGLCPNCGGPIESERLERGLVCSKCLPDEQEMDTYQMLKRLKSLKRLKGMDDDYRALSEYASFERMFIKAVGARPSGAQRNWALRLFYGDNFSITAPPGSGKTTFGLVMALYFLSKGAKSLLIVPTRALATQLASRLQEYAKKLGAAPRVFYYGAKGVTLADSDIAITTSKFMFAHFDEVNALNFEFVFVDDVDAALKSNKSVSLVLKLVGFSDEDIQEAKEAIANRSFDIQRLSELRREKIKRRVLFSSGTITRSNPLFLILMGFRPGSPGGYLRNVIDTYVVPNDTTVNEAVKIVKMLGGGGLLFVSEGEEAMDALLAALSDAGIRASKVTGKNVREIERFSRGELDVLVGAAAHYGTLVRGIDLPERVRYAVFVGVPRFAFRFGERPHPIMMMRVISAYATFKQDRDVFRLVGAIRKKISRMSVAALQVLAKQAREGGMQDPIMESGYNLFSQALSDREFVAALPKLLGAVIKGDRILVPDVTTYIQASGRTSRLRPWGNTLGLSVIVVDEQRLFDLFMRFSSVAYGIEWKQFNEVDISSAISMINKDRERVREESEAKVISETSKYTSALLIVESPHKAKTIASFFSRPAITVMNGMTVFETAFEGTSLIIAYTAGHITDLTLDGVGLHGVEVKRNEKLEYTPHYSALKECENHHQVSTATDQCPICGGKIARSKEPLIGSLRRIAISVDEVLLGTDPDTEGEKISWDLERLLKPYNKNIRRIEFHEVTRQALINAIRNRRDVKDSLVAAQVVRRVDDRWVGFELSARLQSEFWKKYCEQHIGSGCDRPNKNLSAGRVQTPVLGWIIDRYRAYSNKSSTVRAHILRVGDRLTFRALSSGGMKVPIGSTISVDIRAESPVVVDVHPRPPYMLSEALRDISNFFRLSTGEAMYILQTLFEAGLITYPRTDSTRVSDAGIALARTYITQNLMLGEEYFVGRTWGEGGAHEAIRPTRPLSSQDLRTYIQDGLVYVPVQLSYRHYQVYDLIFRRFIASQMAPAKALMQRVSISGLPPDLKADPDTIMLPLKYVFDGFARIMPPYKELYDEVKPGKYNAVVEKFFEYKSVELYSEGDLVEEMKKKGIGRPSTYSTIISTILTRRYVILSGERKKLIPTKLGIAAHTYLVESFGDLVSETLTARLESMMDEVEEGKRGYNEVLDEVLTELKERLKASIPKEARN